ncbi:hypothetical protein OBBRIDRAFT_805948 [Obba rivulosa]|uniref:Uncharacterized protein n=1 Tax=Obba rivulosa TaxID=1052685 RepID=A0A8E2ASZ5_9APHY|nr:hypothetical protein OBBRIDRAFT_805948 [Obba rivulosa]
MLRPASVLPHWLLGLLSTTMSDSKVYEPGNFAMSFLNSGPAYFHILGVEIIDHQHFLHLFDLRHPDYDFMVNTSSCNRIPAARVKNWVPEPWRHFSIPPGLDAIDILTIQDLITFAQVPDAIYLIDPSIRPPTHREIRNKMLVARPYAAFLL